MLGTPAKPAFPAPFEGLRPLVSRGAREVWLARDTRLNRLVVAKRLPRSCDTSNGEARLAGLRHPTLVDIYGVVSVQGRDWLVSEYVDGRSLDSGDQLWSVSAVLHTLDDLCGGLVAMAGAGLVHGDLSPGNVMVGVGGQLRLIDFTQTQGIGERAGGAGTPGFAAPEVVNGCPVGSETDVWSLAALGVWMMSGQGPAWVADDRGLGSLVVPVWRPPDPASEQLRAWLVAALRADSANRPDARMMAAEVRRIRHLFALDDRSELRAFARVGVESSDARGAQH